MKLLNFLVEKLSSATALQNKINKVIHCVNTLKFNSKAPLLKGPLPY